jgi:hypothetical protein
VTAVPSTNSHNNQDSVLLQTDEHTASDGEHRGFQSGDFVDEDDEDTEQIIQKQIELLQLRRKRKQAKRMKHGGTAGASPSL